MDDLQLYEVARERSRKVDGIEYVLRPRNDHTYYVLAEAKADAGVQTVPGLQVVRRGGPWVIFFNRWLEKQGTMTKSRREFSTLPELFTFIAGQIHG